MKINNPAQIVSIGGILTTLAVLFQSLPVFLPGMGLIISPLATLPIALAAVGSTNLGVISLFSSTLILLLISPQEAVIFLFATGLLGLTLGASYNKRITQSIATATITLFIGINILIHIVGIAAFGDLTPDSSLITEAFIIMLFSLIYSGMWIFILRFFVSIFKKTKHFSIFQSKQKE